MKEPISNDMMSRELAIEIQSIKAEARAEITPERLARIERTLHSLAELSASQESAQRDADLKMLESILADDKAIAACVIMRVAGRVTETASRILARVGRGLIMGAIGMA